MNETQMLAQLAETDAYAPETEMPASAWGSSVAFSEIERRIEMQTQTTKTSIPPERTTSRGWLVAAAAFVVVIALGAVLMVSRSNTDVPPATTPTTQTAPDGVTDTTLSAAALANPVPVTMETLAGIWLQDSAPGSLVRFSLDGTYAIDMEGALDTAPSDSGTFEFSGSTLTFTSGASTIDCNPGDKIVWENVALIETGRLTRLHASDQCIGNRNPSVGTESTWTIISPRRGSTPK